MASTVGAGTTLIGQIDTEMEGQSVVVAGMVASVRYLNTRDGRSFASAVLEDLDGRIEVMVWPKVFANTKELWQEGDIVLVKGKVRVRDDQVQLSCDSVEQYQPPAPSKDEEAMAAPAVEIPEVTGEVTAGTEPAEIRRLIIKLSQTKDEDGDITRLHQLIAILQGFPGHDEVKLSIANDDKVFSLRLANISTDYCPELHQRLVDLLGADEFRLEKIEAN